MCTYICSVTTFSALTLLVGWQEGHPVSPEIGDGLSWCVTSHPGQLSLLSTVGWEMNTNQRAAAVLFGREGNAGLTKAERAPSVGHGIPNVCLYAAVNPPGTGLIVLLQF